MEPGLGGPDPGRPKDDRRIGERQVEVEVQHHDGSLIEGEATKLAPPCGRGPTGSATEIRGIEWCRRS